MPYPDSKYPPAPQGHAPSGTFADMEKRHFAGLTERDLRSRQRLLAAAPELLLCLRSAQAAFAELDDDWRNMDATLVDQIIATNRYAIGGCLLRAEGRE
jgi:hypothetical protein